MKGGVDKASTSYQLPALINNRCKEKKGVCGQMGRTKGETSSGKKIKESK